MGEGGMTDDVTTIIDESEFIDIIGPLKMSPIFMKITTQKRRPWKEDERSQRLENTAARSKTDQIGGKKKTAR
jgi:hypothetical protein